jgi:hypothetical protein
MGFRVFTMIPMWGQFALAIGHRSERRGLSCLLLNSGQIDGDKVPSKYTSRFSPRLLYDKELLY